MNNKLGIALLALSCLGSPAKSGNIAGRQYLREAMLRSPGGAHSSAADAFGWVKLGHLYKAAAAPAAKLAALNQARLHGYVGEEQYQASSRLLIAQIEKQIDDDEIAEAVASKVEQIKRDTVSNEIDFAQLSADLRAMTQIGEFLLGYLPSSESFQETYDRISARYSHALFSQAGLPQERQDNVIAVAAGKSRDAVSRAAFFVRQLDALSSSGPGGQLDAVDRRDQTDVLYAINDYAEAHPQPAVLDILAKGVAKAMRRGNGAPWRGRQVLETISKYGSERNQMMSLGVLRELVGKRETAYGESLCKSAGNIGLRSESARVKDRAVSILRLGREMTTYKHTRDDFQRLIDRIEASKAGLSGRKGPVPENRDAIKEIQKRAGWDLSSFRVKPEQNQTTQPENNPGGFRAVPRGALLSLAGPFVCGCCGAVIAGLIGYKEFGLSAAVIVAPVGAVLSMAMGVYFGVSLGIANLFSAATGLYHAAGRRLRRAANMEEK